MYIIGLLPLLSCIVLSRLSQDEDVMALARWKLKVAQQSTTVQQVQDICILQCVKEPAVIMKTADALESCDFTYMEVKMLRGIYYCDLLK